MKKSERLKDSKIYDNIEKFSQVMKQDTELWPIFACQLERMRSIIESPLKIAVMGEFKSGKSSFVNSLLGHHDLLPVGVIPKTATINELIYGQKAQITICYKDNIRENHDGYSILKQYNQASEQDNIVLAHELERVDRIVVTVESDYLKHFTIIDTPGFNQAEAASLDEKSISILAEVDLVIWLFRASQAGTFTEMGYLEKIKGSVKKLYAVFNRIDEVDVNVEELRLALSKHFDGVFINQNTVLGICAEHKHREKNTELKQGFERLLHDLNDLIFNEDYKLSLERLKDIHTNLYSDIAARIQYLDRKSIKLTDGLSTFKNDNFISPENGTCPYAKLLKSHSRELALCFADEIAGEVDRCNRTELLKITKQASNIDVSRSSIIEFFTLTLGLKGLTAASNKHRRKAIDNIKFFENNMTNLRKLLTEESRSNNNIYQSEATKKSIFRTMYSIQATLKKEKKNSEPSSVLAYFIGLIFNGFFMNILDDVMCQLKSVQSDCEIHLATKLKNIATELKNKKILRFLLFIDVGLCFLLYSNDIIGLIRESLLTKFSTHVDGLVFFLGVIIYNVILLSRASKYFKLKKIHKTHESRDVIMENIQCKREDVLQKLDLYLIEIFYVNHYKMTEVCNEITQTTIDLINLYREKKELLTKAKEKLK